MNNQARFWMAVRADLTRVARLEGRPKGVAPRADFYRRQGRWNLYQIRKMTGGLVWRDSGHCRRPKHSWTEAVEKLGFISAMEHFRLGDRLELVHDLRRVAVLVGKNPRQMPTIEEYTEHGNWSRPTIVEHLSEDGSWRGAAETAGLQPANKTPYGSVTKERMIEDYREACQAAGLEPGGPGLGAHRFSQVVSYSPANTHSKFGSWNGLVIAAGYQPRLPDRKE